MESDERGTPQLRVPQQGHGQSSPGQWGAGCPWQALEAPTAALPQQDGEAEPEGPREVQQQHGRHSEGESLCWGLHGEWGTSQDQTGQQEQDKLNMP